MNWNVLIKPAQVPVFDDHKNMIKHVFEMFLLSATLVMVVLHIVDNVMRRIPGLGTTDLILIGIGISIIFYYMGYQIKMNRVVTKYWRINRKIRYPTGIVQCYDEYGAEYMDASTLAVENQYGLKYPPIELFITDDGLKRSMETPYMAKLPRTMNDVNLKTAIEKLAGIDLTAFHVYDLIWDRPGYHKVIGDIESEQPPTSFSEQIVYSRKQIMEIMKIGPNQAFSGGWLFPHSSVGDLNLDHRGMIKGDVELCQVQEASNKDEEPASPDQEMKIIAGGYDFLINRVTKKAAVLARWFEQESDKTDEMEQDEAHRAVEEDKYMAEHPDEAIDDYEKFKSAEADAKKQAVRSWGWLKWILGAIVLITIIMFVFK
jgi:hypothetical protein